MTFNTTDLCDEHGDLARVVVQPLVDFGARAHCSGPAVTVKCFEDNSHIKTLSMQSGEGRVLVVDGGGSHRCALLGDMIAEDLLKNGWAGVIINGCIRDKAALAQLDIAIKALGTSPRKSVKREEGQVGLTVNIGGQLIANGDRIYADEDGVVVIDTLTSQ
ncbi:ribonuclease E activity regulator RraA [Oceanisphaera psychrotolerans]|uniref:4-hydroxy-4-methyl-2-oxoglutarate aldolase n=1 Tax=Oceanisphaera psychrotolerans TaxID=1414654 RepID=A0A1J4QF45_9GAMM|nr:ribonuclease E activity regulator RraA [Oceanisphaera psychrotolerans]OIN12441.1 ribonuclease activity regulator protein RraA [Oceanisphaera psychrotolerans]